MTPPIPALVFPRKTVQGDAGAEAAQAQGQESEAQPSSEHNGGFQIRGMNLVMCCSVLNHSLFILIITPFDVYSL